MYFVYFLRSINNPEKTYSGYTTNVQERLNTHNMGGSIHTAKYKPWHLITYIAFNDEQRAKDFEKYIKMGSGNAYAKKKFF